MSQYDVVVRGGTVLDGTGSAARSADVGIKNGIIVEVGQIKGSTNREIQADGALVTPGFVDIHTHYDGQATWSNRMSPSSHHGVTTAIMGNCGVGFAPVRSSDHDMLIELMEGVEDIPGVALQEGLPWAWESFPDYLEYLSQRQFDMDLGAQLPHAALRVYVMGQRGADREPANPDDIAQMQAMTTQAMQAGALGFTSSRTLNHRSASGEPTPSLTAQADELLGIAQGMKEAGRGVMEMISDFAELDEEFDLLQNMVAVAGRPMSISLAQGLSSHGWKKVLRRIEHASEQGLVMRGQVAPRPIGILLGLTTTLSPFTTRPSYMELAHMPLADRVQALRDPQRRARILSEPTAAGFARLFNLMDEGRKLWRLDDPPNYEPHPQDSVFARAASLKIDPWALAYDEMLTSNGETLFYTPFANYADNNLDCCREMILHDHTVMGLGDGGAHVGTICDASFITSLLTHWGRDRSRGEKIELATLVKCQTQDTARALGLHDRGVLAPGLRADINVIDFENLQVRLPKIIHDLPAGGARLQQRADGFLATLVAGEMTYASGEATDALPGRLIRPV